MQANQQSQQQMQLMLKTSSQQHQVLISTRPVYRSPPNNDKEQLQQLMSKNTGVSLVFAFLLAVLLTEICQHARGQLPSAMSMQDI